MFFSFSSKLYSGNWSFNSLQDFPSCANNLLLNSGSAATDLSSFSCRVKESLLIVKTAFQLIETKIVICIQRDEDKELQNKMRVKFQLNESFRNNTSFPNNQQSFLSKHNFARLFI